MIPEHNNKIRQRVKASRMGRECGLKKEGVDRTCNHRVPKRTRPIDIYIYIKKVDEGDDSQHERKSDGRVVECP